MGDVDADGRAVEFDLSAGDETAAMTLVLNPPDGGFSEETMKLAEWLSSQAAIALENARLHDIVQFQAITDELTGLVNRRRFLDALRSEITRGSGSAGGCRSCSRISTASSWSTTGSGITRATRC